MSGEEGATFPEKLWWAIDEAKARLDTNDLGELYDAGTLDIDENNNIQLLLFACMAKEEKDILPGHIWVDRQFLETQSMKYNSPKVLDGLLAEQAVLMGQYLSLKDSMSANLSHEESIQKRNELNALKETLDQEIQKQKPLKWIDRVIMWTADGRPSFADKVPCKEEMDTDKLVDTAISMDESTRQTKAARAKLLAKYT